MPHGNRHVRQRLRLASVAVRVRAQGTHVRKVVEVEVRHDLLLLLRVVRAHADVLAKQAVGSRSSRVTRDARRVEQAGMRTPKRLL